MKNKKLFIISVVFIAFVGICFVAFNNVNTKNKNLCVGTNMNKTTEYKNDEIVAEHEEYFFGCLCNGKFVEGFNFVSSNPVAGPNCDERCIKACQNKNFKISSNCLEPAVVNITENQNTRQEYFSQCLCMISENGSEPIGMDLVHSLQYQSETPRQTEVLCNKNCQKECENKFQNFLKNNPDFQIPKRW